MLFISIISIIAIILITQLRSESGAAQGTHWDTGAELNNELDPPGAELPVNNENH